MIFSAQNVIIAHTKKLSYLNACIITYPNVRYVCFYIAVILFNIEYVRYILPYVRYILPYVRLYCLNPL